MNLKIEGYSFGRITVSGKEYTTDLILYPDGRIEGDWWRAQGHSLIPEDLDALIETAPARLIVGTGADGRMKVSERLLEVCRMRGIEVQAFRTAEAVKRFNESVEAGVAVGACFHLTC